MVTENEDLSQAEFWIDWHIAGEGRASNWYKLIFRRSPHALDGPSRETRTVYGKDRDDAIRNFAAQLEEEELASTSRL